MRCKFIRYLFTNTKFGIGTDFYTFCNYSLIYNCSVSNYCSIHDYGVFNNCTLTYGNTGTDN